jgi:polyhydroxyalkanoate synthesis regulator phasin
VRDALKSYLTLASGVSDVTRQRALAAAKALVSQGEATAEQVSSLAEDLLAQTRQNREAVVALVGFEVDRALGRVGLAGADELAALTERVRMLETRVAELSAHER